MALFFALLYITTAYLAPQTIFGDDLAQAHIQVVIAVIALILAFLSGAGSGFLSWIQTWAIVGVSLAVAMSLFLVWGPRAGVEGMLQFIPNAATFFMIALSCKKKWHLQAVVGLLFLVSVFILVNALYAKATGDNAPNRYLLFQNVEDQARAFIIRIRGLGFLGDPNDLAQFFVSLIPFLFFFWARERGARNLLLVYLPSALLAFGMFETHSRGGMMALLVMIMVAARKKIGLVPAAITSAVLFVGLTAAGFTGGRDVTAGEDRVGAWSEGLVLIRSHPIFGVGFYRFSDFYEITAHNTFIVCAAELGLIGVFFWLLLIVVTMRNSYVTTLQPGDEQQKRLEKEERSRSYLEQQRRPAQATAIAGAGGLGISAPHGPVAPHLAMTASLRAEPVGSLLLDYPVAAYANTAAQDVAAPDSRQLVSAEPHLGAMPFQTDVEELPDETELRRLSNLVTISFAGFFTAGWFLSRSYTMCLYVNVGLAAAIYRMALARGMITPMPLGRALKSAAVLEVVLLIVVYIIVVSDHLVHR